MPISTLEFEFEFDFVVRVESDVLVLLDRRMVIRRLDRRIRLDLVNDTIKSMGCMYVVYSM